MGTLLTMQPLPLLLLLLQPFPFQFLMLRKYLDLSPSQEEAFQDYLAELYTTGPTKPPTKESFQKDVIIDFERPLSDFNYCCGEILMKNVHTRLHCRKEHFFLGVEYKELQKLCKQRFVACKNGVKRCHRSLKLIEGVYCNLTDGVMMPDCRYQSFYKKGYVLITCRWQDDIRQMIPAHVNDILETHYQQ
ncbi:ribonuclease A family member 9 (inactive) [Rhinolophus ferrumequinum]|uniref:Inactive ribonuclease-like protein 9 n=1 Tax=Rhinolophus ferrumequinum TaxID=59479 RepID=A0A7J7XSD8_RHIFE|nr:inactive ribonuclease-like protein 9 [Rhinolophus ferrumequinum]KAF6352286.1 ribonuclease A family member 9 (inactive) [Rhinolophus ferrumequinum]